MSSCGAETHLLFTGHSAIDASDTSAWAAGRAWSARWPASPKGASKVSREARRSSEENAWGRTHRTVPITNRHDSPWFESFRSHFAFLFWSFWLAISEPGWTSRKKVPFGIRLKSTRPSYVRVIQCQIHHKPGKKIDDRGFACAYSPGNAEFSSS